MLYSSPRCPIYNTTDVIMKVETSVTLSEEVIEAIDGTVADDRDLSEFIEAAIWAFLRQIGRQEQQQRDLEILNQHADRLNEEAFDVLEYQVSW